MSVDLDEMRIVPEGAVNGRPSVYSDGGACFDAMNDSLAMLMRRLKMKAFGADAIRPKPDVRSEMKRRRLIQDRRASNYKSRKINERLLALDELARSQTIAAYLPIQGEVDLSAAIHAMLNQGRRVVLPKVAGDSIRMFHVANLDSDVTPGVFGILEPVEGRCAPIEPREIDCVLIPGVAFDYFGHRVGQGGGFYDRFLPLCREGAPRIAAAFSFQVVPAVEALETDAAMNRIIAEDGVFAPMISQVQCAQERDTKALAKRLVGAGMTQGAVALHGGLGTGKTVFVKGAAGACSAAEGIASPTFVFCHEYHGAIPVYHIDCYRMDQVRPEEEEFWLEMIHRPGIALVEWAERIAPLLPPSTPHVFGEINPDGARDWTLFTPMAEQNEWHKVVSC